MQVKSKMKHPLLGACLSAALLASCTGGKSLPSAPSSGAAFKLPAAISALPALSTNDEVPLTPGPLKKFDYTGASQEYAAALDAWLTIRASGGEGGGRGGEGGTVSATILTQSDKLGVFVGGRGATGDPGNSCAGGAGGYNGGGSGGGASGCKDRGSSGNGGGGASDVREGGAGAGLDKRLVVAAGGGGRSGSNVYGGGGGKETGENGGGDYQNSRGNTIETGGKGGTQTAGGSRGGELGRGGAGASVHIYGGGGGGAGYYGGGGGGGSRSIDGVDDGDGGGGGGSDFAVANARNVTMTQGGRTGDGLVEIYFTALAHFIGARSVAITPDGDLLIGGSGEAPRSGYVMRIDRINFERFSFDEHVPGIPLSIAWRGGLEPSYAVVLDENSNTEIYKFQSGAKDTVVVGKTYKPEAVAIGDSRRPLFFTSNYKGGGAVFELLADGAVQLWKSEGLKSADGIAKGGGKVYVADYRDNAVKVTDESGGPKDFRSIGGGFKDPTGVTVDKTGTVYVVDAGNHAVKKIPPGCLKADCVITVAQLGSLQPEGVALGPGGYIYVTSRNGDLSPVDAVWVFPP
jgi:hypothetical protein